MQYFHAGQETVVVGVDGNARVTVPCIPIPILDADFAILDGESLSYDAVGQGIYFVLRYNPDCGYAREYAQILRDGYPHYISELASHILMLGQKEVDVGYLDRRINYLKIFALLEPENSEIFHEIGVTLLDKGLSISSLRQVTVTMYKAEEYFRKALFCSPQNEKVKNQLGEVCYILGKYDQASAYWTEIMPVLEPEERMKLEARLRAMAGGDLPRIPAVDYLEAIAIAFELQHAHDHEEALAILQDVINDEAFCHEFPMPELFYMMGLCYRGMNIPTYAEDQFRRALALKHDYPEAMEALAQLYS